MSEQTQKTTDQLFDSKSSDGVTEPAEDTTSDPKPNADLGTINRDRQIKVWADRLESGDKSLEDLPQNMGWLKPLVEEEVDRRKKTNDVEAIVEARLSKIREEENRKASEARFADLKKKANTMDISDSDKLMVEEAYQRLKSRGMSAADALEEAITTFEIVSKNGDKAIEEMKKRMRIPTQTKAVDDSNPEYGTEEFFQKGDAKSRIEKYEQIRTSGGMK